MSIQKTIDFKEKVECKNIILLNEFYIINHDIKEYVYVNTNTKQFAHVSTSMHDLIKYVMCLVEWKEYHNTDIYDVDTFFWNLNNNALAGYCVSRLDKLYNLNLL